MRLDAYLAQSGLARSRTHAQKLIDGGFVSVNGKTADKPSLPVEADTDRITVTGEPYPFVGRGGVKLEAALTAFGIDVTGMTAVDIGASTGGFTDCLLRRGAKHIFCVDSGTGQLAKELLADSRVTNIERFNARTLSPATLGALCNIAVMDLSFISACHVLPNAASVLLPGGIYVGLVKPQFECGIGATDQKGIIRDPKLHREAVRKVVHCAASCGLQLFAMTDSPILGGDGNREFLIACRRSDEAAVPEDFENMLCELVKL